ncbi:CorA metal ion transporter, putative [Bodo saltans]|uniref:CorA metal ion transporter, putative n=1 Tax=Bodo saltans TaxID=75058 RepID=A0A0S4JCC1_BODSA|nr:CorA metal ion transporter, putative [Bodo saltans]|eukprot:CUG89024.1 CorA metal ion transporter, putative [Bodo saltans]
MSDEIAHNALASIDLIIALSEFNSNTNMKTFTYMTILLQPVTVATSWYGMNWGNMPELEYENSYFYFTGITWFVSFAVFAYFTLSRHALETLAQQISGSLGATRKHQLMETSTRGGGGSVNSSSQQPDCFPTDVSFLPLNVSASEEAPPTTWRTLSRKLSVNPKLLKTALSAKSEPLDVGGTTGAVLDGHGGKILSPRWKAFSDEMPCVGGAFDVESDDARSQGEGSVASNPLK